MYDLDRLSALGFQDMAAALAVAVFGPVVRRLGRGKDGGRDMEANGLLVWSGADEARGEAWDGYTVFQVKHRERPHGDHRDARVLWNEIRKELNAWADPDSSRDPVPRYLVFVSNVRLSPQPGQGGLAHVQDNLAQYMTDLRDRSQDVDELGAQRRLRRQRMQPLKKYRVIDGNQLDAWLDVHEGVRRAYGGFLTTGDVLADLVGLRRDLSADELGPALQTHARNSLVRDRNVYFDDSGGQGVGVPLDSIAVDLPVRAHASGEDVRAIRFALDRGEHVLKPSVATVAKPRHLVLTGAPGNGKTTISRFVVQAYRASLLAEADALGEDHTAAIDGTRTKLAYLGGRLPTHRRWSIRVDLAEFAQEFIADKHKSLMAFIARQVTAQSYARALEPWNLKEWMTAWPTFVALDGLDEVSEPRVRNWVIECVHEFVADAESDDADLFVLVTTRPTGYVDEMSAAQFERVDLTDLTVGEALAYGHLVTKTRLGHDVARIERVDGLLESAAQNENLKHLLRTPLQVRIMSIIAEGAGTLDPDRFGLFWRYYDVVARREQAKPDSLFVRLLRENAEQVLDLHERVGLELQRRSESADGATAAMSETDLSDIAWHVLVDDGYDPAGRDSRLHSRIVQAATHRLVLLVPRSDGYGFDVRSLQEMMAARRLTTGDLDTVLDRLKLLAPSPHWRNTWLFAAGRLFSEPQVHQHEQLIELVATVDQHLTDAFSSIAPIGPYLAWDMLDDGMTAARPRWVRQLFDLGMTALDYPAPQPVGDYSLLLLRLSESDDELRGRVRAALRTWLRGDGSSRTNASALMDEIEVWATVIHLSTEVRMLARVKPEQGRSALADPVDGWSHFDEVIHNLAASDELTTRLTEAGVALRDGTAELLGVLKEIALDPEASELLELALEKIVRTDNRIAGLIFELARTTAARRQLSSVLDQDRL